ncbi:hypothetical protein D3C81_1989370 [compost metagenome]
MLFSGGTTNSFLYLGSFRSFQDVGGAHFFSSKAFLLYMMPVATMPMATALSSL